MSSLNHRLAPPVSGVISKPPSSKAKAKIAPAVSHVNTVGTGAPGGDNRNGPSKRKRRKSLSAVTATALTAQMSTTTLSTLPVSIPQLPVLKKRRRSLKIKSTSSLVASSIASTSTLPPIVSAPILSQPVPVKSVSPQPAIVPVKKAPRRKSLAYLAAMALLPTPTPSPSPSEPDFATMSSRKLKSKHSPAGIAARLAKEMTALNSKEREYEWMREQYARAKVQGGAVFLSIDVETFEFNHDALLEFGWAFVNFEVCDGDGVVEVIRESQHTIIKQNMSKRNGKFCPDARDHFDFGTSVVRSQRDLFNLLHATISSLSSSAPVFVIFHDPRSDLVSLGKLGFEPNYFSKPVLSNSDSSSVGSPGVYTIDTQKLYSAYIQRKVQTGLGECLKNLNIPTKRLHNAGNDAVYTLRLFEELMQRERGSADMTS